MKLKRKAERRRERRIKGGDLNLSYEKRGLALGVFQRRGTTWNPVAGTQHGGALELFLSSWE